MCGPICMVRVDFAELCLPLLLFDCVAYAHDARTLRPLLSERLSALLTLPLPLSSASTLALQRFVTCLHFVRAQTQIFWPEETRPKRSERLVNLVDDVRLAIDLSPLVSGRLLSFFLYIYFHLSLPPSSSLKRPRVVDYRSVHWCSSNRWALPFFIFIIFIIFYLFWFFLSFFIAFFFFSRIIYFWSIAFIYLFWLWNELILILILLLLCSGALRTTTTCVLQPACTNSRPMGWPLARQLRIRRVRRALWAFYWCIYLFIIIISITIISILLLLLLLSSSSSFNFILVAFFPQQHSASDQHKVAALEMKMASDILADIATQVTTRRG